jgi:hypothetical protein
MTKHNGVKGLEVGTVVAFYARLVNGSTGPWHQAGSAVVLAGDIRPHFSASAAHLAPAWDARVLRASATDTIEFGVLVAGRVERVGACPCTGRVRADMRALAPRTERPRFGGGPRLAGFRWPDC